MVKQSTWCLYTSNFVTSTCNCSPINVYITNRNRTYKCYSVTRIYVSLIGILRIMSSCYWRTWTWKSFFTPSSGYIPIAWSITRKCSHLFSSHVRLCYLVSNDFDNVLSHFLNNGFFLIGFFKSELAMPFGQQDFLIGFLVNISSQ